MADPYELENVANQPETAELQAQLAAQLDALKLSEGTPPTTTTSTSSSSSTSSSTSSTEPPTTSTSTSGVPDTQAPTPPWNVRSPAQTRTSITLAWNAGTDNVGVAGYHVYRNGQYLKQVKILSFTDSGLATNTQYRYVIRAYDAAGNVSPGTTPFAVRTTVV